LSDETLSPDGAARDPAWASNCTLEEVAAILRNAPFTLVLTHARPDGDAVGSSLAIARAVMLAGRSAVPAYSGLWSHRFDPLVGGTKTVRFGAPEEIASKIGGREPDAVVVTDTGAWQQVAEARRWIEPRRGKVVVIDHHVQGDADMAARRHIDTSASAACQPAAELCRLVLGLRSCAELPLEVAEPLYVGLATDTGWFRHSNVTPLVFALGADLLRAGVNHARCYSMIEQADTISRPRLMARALTSLTLHYAGRLAVMTLSRKDFEECGGTLDDAGGMGDLPMCVGDVRASAILTETDAGVTKVSLRSKRLPDGTAVDVNQVARPLGGGGHKQASGARIKAPLQEAARLVVEAFQGAWR
jgi:phosphoesterase RecJ-like protein